jgi:hypothetical protein
MQNSEILIVSRLRELLRTPNRSPSEALSSRYYNTPPTGGYRVDEEEEYLPHDTDDASSIIMLEMITRFGSPETELFMKSLRRKQIKTIGKCKKIKPGSELCEQTCPICLDDFKVNELYRNLDCSHRFHKKCIDHWFRKDHSDCPMCRQQVFD